MLVVAGAATGGGGSFRKETTERTGVGAMVVGVSMRVGKEKELVGLGEGRQ